MTKRSVFKSSNDDELIYCRKCMQKKKKDEFFSRVNLEIDSNGFMSICKQCCEDTFQGYYKVDRDLDKAIFNTCRTLDISYISGAVESVKTSLSNLIDDGKEASSIFSLYKRMIRTDHGSAIFVEHQEPIRAENPLVDGEEGENINLKKFWGDGLTYDDYEFLENKFSQWKRTHKADTMAEVTLLQEICFKQLEIDRKRKTNGNTTKDVQALQELMKTAALDSSKAHAADSGKSQDTFSSFIKTIEENEPAEYYEDKDLFVGDFKDQKELDFYFKKYILRPLRNFITQSRDFSLEADDNEDEEEETIVNMGTEDETKSDDIPKTEG